MNHRPFPRLIFCVCLVGVVPLASSAEISISDGRSKISAEQFAEDLLAVPRGPRTAISHDRNQLARYATTLLGNLRAAEEARAARFDQRPEVIATLRKAERETLVKLYIDAQLEQVAVKLPNFDRLAEEEYLARRDEYETPEAVRVAHILLKVDPESKEPQDETIRAEGEKLLAELKAGADFRAKAKERSDDKGSATSGGELSWTIRGKTVPPFEDAAFSLARGEISGLVRTRFGYHIIKKLDHRPGGYRPFDEVKPQIVKRLRDQQLGLLRNELTLHFQGTEDVQVSEEFAAAVRAALNR